jgi:hypothetical protein
MDGIALLGEARAAGLVVGTDGDRLMIRGPASAGDVARRLLTHKADVLRALDAAPETEPDGAPDPPADPVAPAYWPPDALAAHVAQHGAYPPGGIGAPTPDETAAARARAGEVPDWDDLDEPDGWTCPTCGAMAWWETCGFLTTPPARRCVRCDAEALARSDALAARAVRLRERYKLTPQGN